MDVKTLLTDAGLTAAQLSRLSGTSQTTISRWVQGHCRTPATARLLLQLLAYLRRCHRDVYDRALIALASA